MYIFKSKDKEKRKRASDLVNQFRRNRPAWNLLKTYEKFCSALIDLAFTEVVNSKDWRVGLGMIPDVGVEKPRISIPTSDLINSTLVNRDPIFIDGTCINLSFRHSAGNGCTKLTSEAQENFFCRRKWQNFQFFAQTKG